MRMAVLATFNLAFSFTNLRNINCDNLDPRSGKEFITVKITSESPHISLLFVIRLTVRRANLEVLGVGFVPTVFYRSDVVGLFIQGEAERAFLGTVAGMGVDVDREGHELILLDRALASMTQQRPARPLGP